VQSHSNGPTSPIVESLESRTFLSAAPAGVVAGDGLAHAAPIMPALAKVSRPNLVGKWAGRWSAMGRTGSISAQVRKQTNSRLYGTITVAGRTLSGSVPFKLDKSGRFKFNFNQSGISGTLSGKVSGSNRITGNFSGSAAIGSLSGTFWLKKV